LRYVDKLSEWSGKVFAWLIIPLTFGTVYEVVARYVFNAPTVWAYDMTYMLCGTLFMMGVAYTIRHDAHVRVDLLYQALSPRKRSVLETCLYLIVFFPVTVVLLVKGAGYFWESWVLKETAWLSPWRPVIYPFKAVLPVAALLMILQGIAEFTRHLVFAVRGKQLGT
jgi:TRAP-type mannitol/chloroaromatic compound transport system permease small subunit